ncbi:MAG: hypothetical protein V3R52_05800 [Candidatus Neomarinimicrobiota bacterium]
MKIYIIIITIFCLGILGCEDNNVNLLDDISKTEYYNSEILNGQYLNIYGKWKLIDVSGGITGDGHELNFDFLILKKYGIYGFVENDDIIEFGKIFIDEQTNEILLVTLIPDDNSDAFMLDPKKYITFNGNDSLTLNSPCCDRYNYHFSRED